MDLLGLGSIFSGIFNYAIQDSANTANLHLYNKQQAAADQNMLWQWQREDNAVQRRVADLKAAGLSPVLAAGSSASSTTPAIQTAPRMEASKFDIGSVIGGLQDVLLKGAIYDKTKAETDLSTSMIDKVKQDTQTSRASEIKELASASQLAWDLSRAKTSGTSTKPGQIGATVNDMTGVINNFIRKTTDYFNTKKSIKDYQQNIYTGGH